uniref:Uncharacterized protein n=1 Tax=Anguilla anguilla TaxID=7936 RepID=A0A0E9P6S9_ANGAN
MLNSSCNLIHLHFNLVESFL